jgi:pantoate--beta-alanine ligase
MMVNALLMGQFNLATSWLFATAQFYAKERPMSLFIVRTLPALRAKLAQWQQDGDTIAVVPTMGALHAGHLSLVQAAKAAADRVIVTLFVNPRQFNNSDDLAAYPRTEYEDTAKLAPFKVDVLYAPNETTMYPPGFATTVSVDGISKDLCGAHRPGHFDGVATIVAKLFLQTSADLAFFGEKDFQQIAVVRRMASDLDIPIAITMCPTVREADGLAMASRNMRLSPAERAIAPSLAAALFAVAQQLQQGALVAPSLAKAKAAILAAGFREIDYLDLRDERTLQPLGTVTEHARLHVAAWLGQTRLIDTIKLYHA